MRRRLISSVKSSLLAHAQWCLFRWMQWPNRVRVILATARITQRLAVLGLGLVILGACTLPWHSALAMGSGVMFLSVGASCFVLRHCILMAVRRGWLDTVGHQTEQHPQVLAMIAPFWNPAGLPKCLFGFEWRVAVWLLDPVRQSQREAQALEAGTPLADAPRIRGRL